MVEHRTYDSNAFSHLRRALQRIELRWEAEYDNWDGFGWQTSKAGPSCVISCFSIKNLNLYGFNCDTGFLNEEQLKEQFENYIYHQLYFIIHIKKTLKRRSNIDPFAHLIIDEYGISSYDDIGLIKLTPKQIEEKYNINTEVFYCNSNVQFYIPKSEMGLPVKSTIRIRKSIKLFPPQNNTPSKLHDWGIGKVNCELDADEDFYFKMTNYNLKDSKQNLRAASIICASIDFGDYDINSTNAEYDLKEKSGIYIRYKQYKQEEGSIFHSNAWHAPTMYLTWKMEIRSSELSGKKEKILILKEKEDNRKKEIEEERRRLEEERKRREEEARLERFRYNKRNKHSRDYYISFNETNHTYTVDGNTLQSVTNIVENCFPKFDAQLHAKATAAKMGMTEEEVIAMWERKGKESRELGTAMHKKIENYYKGQDSWEDDSYRLFKMFAEKVKLEPYRTEWAVYDLDHNIAGTIDFVDYQNGEYTIYDWKRSDKIIANGMPVKVSKYQEKGLYPLEHLENCAYYHYALQLSLYKFILERNYNMKISKLRLGIFHPTYDKPYVLEMPYLENEVNTLMGLRSEVIM